MEIMVNQRAPYRPANPSEVLVDVLRTDLRLKGTTVACREGDCGACTVLVGQVDDKGKMSYRPITSCISPVGNAASCHVVTVEGVSQGGINPLQDLLCQFSGTQCGFCTPGFILSLTGFLLNSPKLSYEDAVSAIDGNICRCTGYKSIQRAIKQLITSFAPRLTQATSRIDELINAGLLPEYFSRIPQQLVKLAPAHKQSTDPSQAKRIGGGTDLFVQKPEILRQTPLDFMYRLPKTRSIEITTSNAIIPAQTSIQDFCSHPQLQQALPCLARLKQLFASTQIRNQGSIAGNIINASPIGDVSNFILALDATLLLNGPQGSRQVLQKDFYLGYKIIDLHPQEQLEAISFALPTPETRCNFEKVSRRTHLDIASVNSGFVLQVSNEKITYAAISAGGVAPTPLRLSALEAWLLGRTLDANTVREAARIARESITPIDDVRGLARYKELLLGTFIYAHFLACYPETIREEELLV